MRFPTLLPTLLFRRRLLPLAVLGAVAALAAGSSGCVIAATGYMANPLVTGAVPQNHLDTPDVVLQNFDGLPYGSLVDGATLASLDAQQACFDVVLRTDGARAQLVSPSGWRVFLRGSPSFENKAPIFGPPMPVGRTFQPGLVNRQATRNERICDDNGNCVNRTVTFQTQEAVDVEILTGGGRICFAHAGTITPQTKEITLHLDDPGNLGHRIAFRWRFD